MSIDRQNQSSCSEFNRKILRHVAQNDAIDTVVLAARWALSTSGARYKTESGKSVVLVDLESDVQEQANVDLVNVGLRRTVTALKTLGKRVVVVKQVPEVGYDVPSANYSAKLSGRNVNAAIAPKIVEYTQRTADAHRIIDKLRDESFLSVIDPSSLLCSIDSCDVAIDGMPLYRDDHHLSLRGNILIADLFDKAIGDEDEP